MLGSLSKRLEDLSLVQRERLAYIDFRLYFFGEIGRPDLIERFGVAPAGATRDLALYREIAPHNITFDGSNKIYRIGQEFSPLFEHASLRVLSALSLGFGDGVNGSMQALLPCESPAALSIPKMDVLATICRGIHAKRPVAIRYYSMSSGESERVIVPFALVDTGMRWHVPLIARVESFGISSSPASKHQHCSTRSHKPTNDRITTSSGRASSSWISCRTRALSGPILSRWTIVDATLIHAPSSSKNQDGKRDPKMHQTKKGNQYYFGMKAHIGVDDESGLVHSVVVAAAPLRALFAPATASATLLLWLCYFFTLLVVYMLINWLPMLLVEQGFRPSQAAGVMFALQIGAASGTLILGALMDKLRPVVMSLLIYTGMLASLLALGTVSSLSGMLMAGFVAGMFATGGQSVLYALAPLFYSTQIRATGVGTAVAVGRLGAMSGPLLAGKMLALGTGTVGVMAASAPGILLAGLAVFILMSRKSRMPIPASGA